MSLFDENTLSNPLYLENAEGLDASFDQAVFQDNTDEVIAGIRRRKAEKWGDLEEESEDYYA